ncbi:MAG: tRNA isopentenyl-2-thiomethyl-A-37 hydroxylase MiaE [Planctomycetota bacterium]
MIKLAWDTPREWAERAVQQPLLLLSDHAHCELRAATSAQALITKNPTRRPLVERLAPLAIEELQHFRRVLGLLSELGGELLPALPNPYMDGLLKGSAQTRTSTLLDRLLVAALIERRSHERFVLLAEASTVPAMARLYAELGPSEAGHGLLFVDLAQRDYPREDVDRRLAQLIEVEGAVMASLGFDSRVHSGVAPSGIRALRPTSVS